MSIRRTDRGSSGPEGHGGHTSLPDIERLRDLPVHDLAGDRVGTVDDVYVDDEGGFARYLGVSTGRFGGRLTIIPIDDVSFVPDREIVVIPYDADDLRAAPGYEADDAMTISREREIDGPDGRVPYRDIVRARQSTPAPTPEIAVADAEDDGFTPPLSGEAGADVAARQSEPAPTPEIAGAEIAGAAARGEDPNLVRVKRWGV